jgi:hypothetical protein
VALIDDLGVRMQQAAQCAGKLAAAQVSSLPRATME